MVSGQKIRFVTICSGHALNQSSNFIIIHFMTNDFFRRGSSHSKSFTSNDFPKRWPVSCSYSNKPTTTTELASTASTTKSTSAATCHFAKATTAPNCYSKSTTIVLSATATTTTEEFTATPATATTTSIRSSQQPSHHYQYQHRAHEWTWSNTTPK